MLSLMLMLTLAQLMLISCQGEQQTIWSCKMSWMFRVLLSIVSVCPSVCASSSLLGSSRESIACLSNLSIGSSSRSSRSRRRRRKIRVLSKSEVEEEGEKVSLEKVSLLVYAYAKKEKKKYNSGRRFGSTWNDDDDDDDHFCRAQNSNFHSVCWCLSTFRVFRVCWSCARLDQLNFTYFQSLSLLPKSIVIK